MRLVLGLAILLLCATGTVSAQAPEPPPLLRDRPDADPPAPGDVRLGPVFQSRAAGVALRPPIDCKQARGGNPDEIVQFNDEARKWQIKLSRAQFGQALPLTTFDDDKGKRQPGLLELRVNQLKLDSAGAEILRDEVVPIGGVSVGIIAARCNIGLETLLHQQAMFQASKRDYFVLTFTSPAPRGGDIADDRGVREAVETFNAMLDSVRLLDQTEIKLDQDQRLYRTRALFLNINETRLRDALIDSQWLRIIQDGKDIGYMYVVEETASDLPRKPGAGGARRPAAALGVLVGMRSRTRPEARKQIDAESWMWVSFDRRHERWQNIAVIDKAGKTAYSSDLGASDRPTLSDARGEDKYVLTVQHMTRSSTAQPVTRNLPVFYLPQALGHLLPRLVPRFEQKGYLFATYVPEQREVMTRYVDVGREEEISLNGQTIRAIPIHDRIGLEGSLTTHYVSPEDGKYLGSINEDSKMIVLPTDAKTLESLWKDANLTRPGAVDDEK
jgi:hypothetical protein